MNKNVPLPAHLMNFILGKWISKSIYAVAELGIADILAEEKLNIDQLAAETNSNSISLYRVMRALASVGIFMETDDKHFENTPISELLKSGVMRVMPLMFHSIWNDVAWMHLVDNLKTGNTAFETAYGVDLTTWLQENPKAAKIFNEANAAKAAETHRAILEKYDFTKTNTISDIGGGNGALMFELLNAYPNIQGVILDLPNVLEAAKVLINKRGLSERCKTEACDFFLDPIPPESDIYLLSNILHDWSDDKCKVIMENCRKAMRSGNKLLIIEMIVPTGNQPSMAKLLDLEMLVMTGGKERTEEEFKSLIESSDLNIERLIHLNEDLYALECTT